MSLNFRPWRQAGDIAGLEKLIADSAANHVARRRADPFTTWLYDFAAEVGAVITQVGQGDKDGNTISTPAETDYIVSNIEPAAPMIDQPTEPPPPVVSAVELSQAASDLPLFDPDLERICDTRDEFRLFRLWVYGHHFDSTGSGKVERTALLAYLLQQGIVGSKRTFDDILAADKTGLYWTCGYARNASGQESAHLWLTGWIALSDRITALELAKAPYVVKPDRRYPNQKPIIMRTVDTNRPGLCRVRGDLSGDIADARARAYAAWISVKAQKNGYLDISRRVLQALWHKSRKTLIEWERRAGLRHENVYWESQDIHHPLIPAHAYLCRDINEKEYSSWRYSNRFIPIPVAIHPHGGQRRKVRKVVNARMRASEPVFAMGDGLHTGRTNFDKRTRAKRAGINGKAVHVTESALAQLRRHLTKHGDVHTRRHALYLGKRRGVHIMELSIGDQFRDVHMTRSRRAENAIDYASRAFAFRVGWEGR